MHGKAATFTAASAVSMAQKNCSTEETRQAQNATTRSSSARQQSEIL